MAEQAHSLSVEAGTSATSYIVGGESYRWELPHFAVEFRREAFALLAEGVVRARKMPASGGDATGGILFGSCEPDGEPGRIEAFDLYYSPVLHDVLRLITERVSGRSSPT